MLLIYAVLALVPTVLSCGPEAIKVVLSNDDGWAEINIREFFSSLTGAGFNTLISAPAENESGTGSSDSTPTVVGSGGCEFGSCAAGSPAYGNNASEPRFNYVNSYPVTSMRYGIQNLSCPILGGAPDIAVAGFNVGSNLGVITLISGTVGAATEAAKEGIPGIAFSGTSGSQTAWNATVEPYMTIYADLSTTVTQALTGTQKPYLPSNTWLNVNYPSAGTGTNCTSTSDFKFVLSRINTAVPFLTPDDVVTCNNAGRLPTESTVVGTAGCYASISVGLASNKLDANASQQAVVLKKLSSILSCLPA